MYLLAKNRRVRQKIEDARCNFLHIDIPITDRKKRDEVGDNVDPDVYRRWDQQKGAIDRAERLLTSPVVFDSPKQFAYDHTSLGKESNLSPRNADGHLFDQYSSEDTLNKRTVIVVPIRDSVLTCLDLERASSLSKDDG